MKRSIAAMTIALAAMPLAACVENGWGYGYGYGPYVGGVYSYDGYYDDYYGPFFDGYWGTNGYFYYRRGEHDRSYHRGGRDHFRRGGEMPGGRFHPMRGDTRPQQGVRMPHFGAPGGHRGTHDRNRGPR